jgi:hypothetical protein
MAKIIWSLGGYSRIYEDREVQDDRNMRKRVEEV